MIRGLITSALLLLLPFGVQASPGTVFLTGDKSIMAGDPMTFTASGLLSGEEVGINLTRPDGSVMRFEALADEWGKVRDEIHGTHVRKAGDYHLSLERGFDLRNESLHAFSVEAAAFSPYASNFEFTQNTAAADGESKLFFRAQLQDHYGNPIARERVDVFSSRNDDLVQHDLESNAAGVVRGSVQSQSPGISVLTLLTQGKTLFEKPEVVFHLPDEGGAIGSDGGLGRFLKAQLFDDTESDQIAYFTIEGLESRILAGETQTFRVIAKNEDGDVVPNYFGTVRFASTDDQAELPADYLYDQKDQGVHEFALAATFNTPGRHSLSVHDLSDFRINGEIDFEVVNSLEEDLNSGTDPFVDIISPTPGTYRAARVTITGEAGGGVEQVKILDGALLLVEDLNVDSSDGSFVYQTAALANGVHEFQAFDMQNRAQSEKVVITIDRKPPSVLAVQIDPAKGAFDPGESIDLTVAASEPLSRADCVLDDINYELEQAGSEFVTTLQAPDECGEYTMACDVADLLGNELREPNAAQIKVCLDEDPEFTGGTGEDPSDGDQGVPPTAPSNLTGLPGTDRVTLVWSPSTDDAEVVQYKVTYGSSPGNLNQTNLIPDNRTRWYVDGLVSDVTYFFEVSAIDDEGYESPPSKTIEVRTLGTTKEEQYDGEIESGSGGWLLSLLVAIGGVIIMRFGMRGDSSF